MIYRNYFGTWGRDLSDGDFSCALAALGVLEARGRIDVDDDVDKKLAERASNMVLPVEWKLFSPFFKSLDLPRDLSATLLSDAWKRSSLAGSARLEVDRASRLDHSIDSQAMLAWIVGELGRPEVKARSVYLRVDRPAATVGWAWPVRVGFLAEPESLELRRKLDDVIHGEAWMQPLVSTVNAQESKSGCDILLIPHGIRKALSLVSGIATPLHADCTVVLGKAEGDSGHWYRMVEGVRAALRTSGVAVAGRETRDIEKWFITLIATLSHNNPIDVALFKAATEYGATPPFIAISHRLAEFSRISMQMRRTAKMARRAAVRDIQVAAEPGSAAEMTVGSGPQSLDHVADALDRTADMGESSIESGGFIHERDAATGHATMARSIERATAAAEPPPSAQEERFIQAKVFDIATPAEPIRRTHCFRGGANHQIVVRIGERDEEWISTPAGPVFPVDALPQDQDEWELTAVLSVAQSSDAPQVSRMVLPRLGNSSEAQFLLFVKEAWKNVEARVVVLHRNRVIQTAMIEGSVGGQEDAGDGITVEPEVVAKTRLDNLGERERFDAAFVINKSKDGVSRLLAISNDKVAKLTPSQAMNDEIRNIDGILTDIVDNPKKYVGKLTSKECVDLLIRLARHGKPLHDFLTSGGDFDKLDLDSNGPLQVISAVPDARLPLELAYSRRAPKTGAAMCPGAAAALRKGKCPAACSKPATEADFICPLAFWGVQRVIERHSYRAELKPIAGGEPFAVVSEPTDLRPALDLTKGGMIAGSQKVEKSVTGGLEAVGKLIEKLTGSKSKPVSGWKDWTAGIRKTGPAVLVLIVHTEETPEDDTIPQMEIGKASWLASVDIGPEHVVKNKGQPPLVLLLGCETGVSDRQFANFVTSMRTNGAAIVVATGAKIHSMHAVPVAKEFIKRIQAESKKKDASFGDVMLAVRREMLADGMPMVLTLNAFGDADWRLAKHS
jgi:hypothetical protein